MSGNRNMRGSVRASAAGAVLALAFLACAAQAQQDPASDRAWSACDSAQNLEARIAACTGVLRRGAGETPQRRAIAYQNRGFAYGIKGDYDRAIADLTEAIRLDAKNSFAFHSRGSAYNAKGEHDHAIADLTEAIRLDPAYAPAWYSRGSAYGNKGAHDRAIGDYSEAIRLDPKYIIALSSRATTYFEKGDYDRAIEDYSAAIRLDPRDAFTFLSRGLAYYGKGDYDRAIADYSEALRLNPKDAEVLANRGYAYMRKGDYDRAIKDYGEVIRLNPSDPVAIFNRAIIYYNKGDYERAIADYSEALRLNPKDADALVNRGDAYAVKGDHRRALADYEAALRIDPALASARRGLERAKSELAAVQPAKGVPEPAGGRGKRALVIGINSYRNIQPLQAALNDARAIADGLRELGFEVLLGEDLDYAGMSARLVDFEQRIEAGDTVFFFFSGHGVAIRGRNYLLPADIARVSEGQEALFEYASFTADKLVERMKGRGARAVILVLDACRDNPFGRAGVRSAWSGTRGLARMEPPEGVFLLFSAATNQVALDRLDPRDRHPNSVFTRIFAEEFRKPGVPINDIAKVTQERVRDLAKRAGKDQRPAYYDEIVGRLSLR